MSGGEPVVLPAREAAFAEWLTAALLAAIPVDGTPITRDDATGGRVFNRAGCPSAVTTGDCYRALLRMANAGVIEWCGEDMKSIRRRIAAHETDLDRALRDDGRKPVCNGGEVALVNHGDRAVVPPAGPGQILAGFYSLKGERVPGRLTADEWDAFVALGNAALGRPAR